MVLTANYRLITAFRDVIQEAAQKMRGRNKKGKEKVAFNRPM